MVLPKWLTSISEKLRAFFADKKVMKTVSKIVAVLVILSFVLNIISAITSDSINSLKFLAIFGWAMAILWFLMFKAQEKIGDNWYNSLMELIDRDIEFYKRLKIAIDEAEAAAEDVSEATKTVPKKKPAPKKKTEAEKS